MSYRRDDTSGFAGRLVDTLGDQFGDANIFRDVDSIPAGANFVQAIDSAVGRCDVFVAVIGRDWLDATNAAGQRRLDDPNDFVRLEIAAALERQIPVLPVLVEGAPMPGPTALPAPLAELSQQNALEISDSRWDFDVGRLVSAIRPHTESAAARRQRWLLPALGALAVVVAFLVGAALFGGGEGGGGGDSNVRLLRPGNSSLGWGGIVEVDATGLPDGKVWFVVQHTTGEYQPDPAPVRTAPDRWVGKVYAGEEEMPGIRFILHVVVASEAASDVFLSYLANAARNGYPGFEVLPDGARSVKTFDLART